MSNLVPESLNLILSQITLEDSVVTVNSNENELVYSLDRGEGKILITAFDLGLEPFISSSHAADHVTKYVNRNL